MSYHIYFSLSCIHYNKNEKIYSVDGTYNNDNKMDVVLNMGFFNITDNVPIDLCSCGAKNKNKEVKFATKYITENINIFKNNILIADRFYFTYEFILSN